MSVADFDAQYDMVTSLADRYEQEVSNFLFDINQLLTTLYHYDYDVYLNIPDIPMSPINLPDAPRPPSITTPSVEMPDAPEAPDIPEEVISEIPQAPQFGQIDIPDMPEITYPSEEMPETPSKPGIQVPDAPQTSMPEEPSLANLDIPPVPSLSLPEPPSVHIPTLEEFGLLDYPELDNVEREINGVLNRVDEALPEASKQEYADLKSTLAERGINPQEPAMPKSVLDDLINTYRERHDALLQMKQDEVLSAWSSRGFTLPVGLASKELKEVTDDLVKQKWDFERDLLNKVFDATREDIKFYTDKYQSLLEYITDTNLKFADLFSRAKQGLYELAARLYSVKADVYRAVIEAERNKVETYNALIRAELSKLETYRVQIEAERAKGEINQQLIDLYRAKLQAVQIVYDVYTRQIEAQNTLVSMYRSEVEAYQALVQAYMLKFRIPELKAQIYQAQVQGKTAQIDAVRARIDAWSAEVQGIVQQNEAIIQSIRAKQEKFRAQVEAFRAEIDGRRAEISAAVDSGRLKTDAFSAEVARYRAAVEALVAEKKTEQEYIRIQLQSLIEKAKLIERRFEANQQAMVQDTAIKARLAEAGARVSGNVMAAALNSMNAIVQLVETTISSA